MSEQLRISQESTYEHEDHGEVEIIEIRRELLNLSIERNDDQTITDTDPAYEWYVLYEYDGGIRANDDKLEDFQQKLVDA